LASMISKAAPTSASSGAGQAGEEQPADQFDVPGSGPPQGLPPLVGEADLGGPAVGRGPVALDQPPAGHPADVG
jgi:hypothetical protein